MSVRQMLYRAEPYQIDIQLEAQPERNRLVVTGQLLKVSHEENVWSRRAGYALRWPRKRCQPNDKSVWRVSRRGRKLRRFGPFLPWPQWKTDLAQILGSEPLVETDVRITPLL